MADFDSNTIYILDSYGLIYRCYFAFISRPLTNASGENVSALFGFFRNFHYILKHYAPKHIFAAMDSKTKTFRHEMYEQYKATRNKTPEDLHAQIPWIEDVLSALGIRVLQCDGYEADDVIATVARKCAENGRTCRILSGDKDLMQLVDDTTQILKPENGSTWKVTGADGVEAEWGVRPEQLLDLLSLYGDTADNIPGVYGIGAKTAAKLLSQYKTLDGIYEHIEEIKGAMKQKLIDGKENAYFSQKLVRLCNTVPCPDIDAALKAEPLVLHYAAAAERLKSYGISAVSKQYAELAVEHGETVFTDGELFGSNTGAGGTEENAAVLPHADAFTQSASSQHLSAQQNLPPLVKNSGEYTSITTRAALHSFIDEVLSSEEKTVAFDCETDSLDTINARIAGFSLCHKPGTAVYIPLFTNNLFGSNELIPKDEAFSELLRLFENPDVTVVLHNGKFDYKVLRSNGMTFRNSKPNCTLADTMIAAWILTPDRMGKNAYSLEWLAENMLRLSGTEFSEIVPKGMTFADIELEKAVPYAAEDTDFTLQLWSLFKKKLAEENLLALFSDTEMKLMPVLAEMELDGIHLDAQTLYDYNTELTTGIEDSENEIYKTVGHTFNIASPKQLQTVLFEERHLKPGKKTKRGYSTDTSVLEELALYDPIPKMILEFREMTKLQSTYVETLPEMCDKNGRIHTDFVQTGTATGRLSCRDPNLQNIPVRNEAGRRIRSAFTAPEGKVLVSADYAQIELVILAHLSGDENMCRAFTEGTDVHKATAALIFGVEPENVTQEMRRTAKIINFGVIYGMSAFRLANDLGISRTKAAEFIENYFNTYSSINTFITETIRKAEEKGYVETLFGRKRPIAGINSKNRLEKSGAERIAVNTPVQGSAADIVKKAMLDVDEALSKEKNGARLLLQVHDELILECPDNPETIEKTIALVKDKMENAVKLSVPLRVSIEYGKNWGEFH